MLRSFVLFAALSVSPVLAAAETTVHVGVGSPSLQFDFLYSDYGVDRVRVEREAACVGEFDFLVALRLSRDAGVDLGVIIGWRRDGMSWDTITRRCSRDATLYYVVLPPELSGPPYGRAQGYWRKHPKGDLHLTDEEIRELVVVQAVSEHCKMSAADVVRRRAGGETPKGIATHAGHREDTAPRPPAAPRGGKAHGNAEKKRGR